MIPFKMMHNMSVLRHLFSNERWERGGGGGAPLTIFFSHSVKMCTSFAELSDCQKYLMLSKQS